MGLAIEYKGVRIGMLKGGVFTPNGRYVPEIHDPYLVDEGILEGDPGEVYAETEDQEDEDADA